MVSTACVQPWDPNGQSTPESSVSEDLFGGLGLPLTISLLGLLDEVF